MAESILGYNILFKATINGVDKIFAGVTTDSLAINPEVKETITKEDRGFKKSKTTGYGYEFSIGGIARINGEGETNTIDIEALREMQVKEEYIDQEWDFVYGTFEEGRQILTGKFKFGPYSEDSNSEDEATWQVACKGTSPFVFAVYGAE